MRLAFVRVASMYYGAIRTAGGAYSEERTHVWAIRVGPFLARSTIATSKPATATSKPATIFKLVNADLCKLVRTLPLSAITACS